MAKNQSGKKGGKKIGRNADWCKGYRLRNQREKNKERKMERHLMQHPNDKRGWDALDEVKKWRGRTTKVAA